MRSATVRAGYVAAAAVASVCGATGPRRLAAATKPVPMALLAAAVVGGRRSRPPGDTALLAGAVLLSALGDQAMLREEFADDPADKDRYLQVGASVFGCAQLCYIGALRRRGARLRATRLAPRMVALGESAAVVATRRPALLPVLLGYGTALGTMSAHAADLPTTRGGHRSAAWGGALFLASDLSIINRRFLLGDGPARRAAEIWVLGSYFAAQGLLVDALTGAAGRTAVPGTPTPEDFPPPPR